MQLVPHHLDWLKRRGISEEVLRLFDITSHEHPTIGPSIRIPFSPTHAKYRRDPLDDRKPKYVYDAGGKVTLYGYTTLPETIHQPTPIVITEGELDCLVLRSQNILAVTSTGGAMSFQEEWANHPHLRLAHECSSLFICFDNDDAGADGMVRMLRFFPNARIIFIPELPGIKDISDYVASGKDFRTLMGTARTYPDTASVEADRTTRIAQWLPVRFHDAYLETHRKSATYTAPHPYTGTDTVLRARSYPLPNLITFTHRTTLCPWHNEKTPSLYYYPQTNTAYCFGGCGRSYDSIDAYRLIHNCSFLKAVEELGKLV